MSENPSVASPASLPRRLLDAFVERLARRAELLRVLPAPPVIAHVLMLLVPVALMAVGFKLHKVALLERELGVGLSLLPADVVTLGVYGGLWVWLLHLSSRGGRRLAMGLFHTLTLAFTALLILEWNFFRTTYEVVDWYMVRYAAEQFDELKNVMLSEVPPILYVGGVALIAFNLSPLLLLRWFGPLRRLDERHHPPPLRALYPAPDRRRSLQASGGLLTLCVAGVALGGLMATLFIATVVVGVVGVVGVRRLDARATSTSRVAWLATACAMAAGVSVLAGLAPLVLRPLDATGPLGWQLPTALHIVWLLLSAPLAGLAQLFERAVLIDTWGAALGAELARHHARGPHRERLLAGIREASPEADALRDAEAQRPAPSTRVQAACWGGLVLVVLVAAALDTRELEDEDLLLLQPNPLVQVFGDGLRDYYLPEPEPEFSFPNAIAGLVHLSATPETKPYNVVLIVMESTRARSVTPYNPKLATTPFLDELSRRGRLVETAYTTIPHTSKALVGIHCGFYPKIDTPIVEVSPNVLPVDCLADLLGQHGYSTAFFQSAEERYERRNELVKRFGFEHFEGKESLPSEGFDECSYFGYEDDVMVEPSLRWVDRQRGPFFLSFLTLTAHHKYDVPEGFDVVDYGAESDAVNNYLNTVRYTDRFVRKIVEGFEARGLLDETLFVIIGDHGEGFGEHRRNQHDNVIYEEGMKVPLLLFGAGIDAPGEPIEGLRQSIDILPTVAEVLGYELSGWSLPGKSLVSTPGHERIFTSCWYHNRCMAMREGDLKYIYHYRRKGMEVFDLSKDPLERVNLLRKETVSRETARRYSAEMRRWQAQTNAYYQHHYNTDRARYVSREAPPVRERIDVVFDDMIRLRGFDAPTQILKPGDDLRLTLHFEALRAPGPGWRLFTHVIKPDGDRINADHIPANSAHPVSKWREGEFIRDPIHVTIPSNAEKGYYTVKIGFWNAQRDSRNARAIPVNRRGSELPGGEASVAIILVE